MKEVKNKEQGFHFAENKRLQNTCFPCFQTHYSSTGIESIVIALGLGEERNKEEKLRLHNEEQNKFNRVSVVC